MPSGLSRKQAIVVAGLGIFTAVAAVGSAVWTFHVGIVAGLVLLTAVLAVLIHLRNQITNAQRAASSTVQFVLSGEVARLREAVSDARSATPIRQALEAFGRDRLEVAQQLMEIEKHCKALASHMDASLESQAELRANISQIAKDARTGFDQVTTDSWSMQNLMQIVDIDGPFPPPGGWALTPTTLLELVSVVQRGATDMCVLECGSGTSTVWFAHCLRAKGGKGRVVALEHDATFAEVTRMHLERLGLAEWAQVRDAPLAEIELNDTKHDWYDPKALDEIQEIDLLFVDGPPWRTSSAARYPAFPILAPSLALGAVVALDDVTREAEREISKQWQDEVHAGRRLVLLRQTDRAQLFVVDSET